MSTLLTRSLVLSFSRFANQAIVLLSPALLVRILSVADYGSYREFMLYAGLIAPLVTFGVASSLQYLIPKHPQREREWVTQTALFILASSTVAIIGIFLAGDLIRGNTSLDFVTALQLYIFFFVNLNFLEGYWLGKKRTDLVLYYSSGRLIMRMVVIVSAAVLTKDVHAIVFSLVALEAVRCLLILSYASWKRWFTKRITRDALALQMSYFLPLGAGAIVGVLNQKVGMLFISTTIGAEALAFFVIGAFATQIVNILRGAVSDVIFPEIVELKAASPKDALPLWQHATVLFTVLLFPMAILFSYYADAIVTILFTKEYSAAIPVFSAFAILLYLDSFDFHLPLRVQNANRFFVVGSIIALAVNLALLYPAYLLFGLVGPAVALILSRLAFTAYLGYKASRLYRVGLRQMIRWREVGKVLAASLICAPVLILGKYLVDQLLVRGVTFGLLYLGSYLVLLRLMGVWDAFEMARRLIGYRKGRKTTTRG